jgi:TetR/AcrR family transcriptional repressor of mexJK operon
MTKNASRPSPRRGGRPSREQSAKLEDKILDAAAALFFSEGYGATSVEEIARRARISKRTFYARFEDKAAAFRAVVRRVILRLRPAAIVVDQLFKGSNVEEVLRRLAPIILRASLSPEALALQRVVLAEAARFPELALIMHEQGARQEAIRRIADLLQKDAKAGERVAENPAFAAEQFLQMVTSAPQRRAMGLGEPLKQEEYAAWANDTVDLFLNGYGRAAGTQ